MPTGIVKWFNLAKGYGFITPDEGGKDVFVARQAVERSAFHSLQEGVAVAYELEIDPDGMTSAANLQAAPSEHGGTGGDGPILGPGDD